MAEQRRRTPRQRDPDSDEPQGARKPYPHAGLATFGSKIDIAPAADQDMEILDDAQPIAARARRRIGRTNGAWVLILGFAVIILVGTVLLKLPWAVRPGFVLSWTDAFFTATSAVTVTGLGVVNTAHDFTTFGQIIILLLLQVGGVGFIAFSVLLFRLIGRHINLQTRFIVQQSLGAKEGSGVLNLALYVLAVTLAIEAVGAALLWLRWRTAMPDGEALWYAIFHAISSYCNAGFDLYSGTEQGVLFGFGTDWYTLGVMGALILVGGFGITVLYDLWSYPSDRSLGLNTRFTLVLSVVLTAIGLGVILFDVSFHRNIVDDLPAGQRLAVGLFTIISARTAGLTILPLPELGQATQLLIAMWMFIGGSPASMAGGVSTSALAVLLAAVLATARGHRAAIVFRRTLPAETIAKAVAIMTVSTLLVVGMTLVLALRNQGDIFTVGFEVVSAFANAGYSLDFTTQLDTFGRYVIAFTMFWGRLGPLTIVVALAQSELPTLVRYPEEPVIMG